MNNNEPTLGKSRLSGFFTSWLGYTLVGIYGLVIITIASNIAVDTSWDMFMLLLSLPWIVPLSYLFRNMSIAIVVLSILMNIVILYVIGSGVQDLVLESRSIRNRE